MNLNSVKETDIRRNARWLMAISDHIKETQDEYQRTGGLTGHPGLAGCWQNAAKALMLA